jgi:hypothetical protein
MDWIDLAEGKEKLRPAVSTFGFHKMLCNSSLTEEGLVSQGGISCVELVC